MAHLVLSASLFTTVSRCDLAFVAIKVCVRGSRCAARSFGPPSQAPQISACLKPLGAVAWSVQQLQRGRDKALVVPKKGCVGWDGLTSTAVLSPAPICAQPFQRGLRSLCCTQGCTAPTHIRFKEGCSCLPYSLQQVSSGSFPSHWITWDFA